MHEVIERLADHQPSRAVVLCGEPEGEGHRRHGQHELPHRGRAQPASALETVRLTLRGDARARARRARRCRCCGATCRPCSGGRGRPTTPPTTPLAAARGDRRPRGHRVGPRGRRARRPCAPSPSWVPDAAPRRHRPRVGRDHRLAPADRPDGGGRVARPACARRRRPPPIAHAPGAPVRRRPAAGGLAARRHRARAHGDAGARARTGTAPGSWRWSWRASRRPPPGGRAGRGPRRRGGLRDRGRRHARGSRVLPLPRPDRARLLAGELELQRRDRAFERALAGACAAGVA